MNARYLGTQFFMINVLRRNLIQKKTAGFDLRHGQLPLLEAAMFHPDCTQQELAGILRVTPASIAQSVARLERAGFIEKRVDPQNKRCNRLNPTDAGRQAAMLYRRSFDEADAFTFAGFTQEQLEQLATLFGNILNNFGEDAEHLPWPPNCNQEEAPN